MGLVNMTDFDLIANQWVKRVVRAEMVRCGLTYEDLARALTFVGRTEDDAHVLRNKIARGTFSAAFFIQCLAAMGVKNLPVDLLDRQLKANEGKPYRPLPEPGGES